MQDGSCDQTLPLSLVLKDAGLGDGGQLSLDSLAELGSAEGVLEGGDESDFPELSAFLSQEEINRSLDLAWEAFSSTGDDDAPSPEPPLCCPMSETNSPPPLSAQDSTVLVGPTPNQTHDPTPLDGPIPLQAQDHISTGGQTCPLIQDSASSEDSTPSKDFAPRKSPPINDGSPALTSLAQNALLSGVQQTSGTSKGPKMAPVYKQDRPRLLHGGPELSDICGRSATFIEELSSIFRRPARAEQSANEDSSSPDSGYLSPRDRALQKQGGGMQSKPAVVEAGEVTDQQGDDTIPEAPPHFLQKLKSQEVSEGIPIRLECRVTGNPQPLVRWFCEGRELHHCPDIQITHDADRHTLVITEAFADDTGRYTCMASNCLGADNTSAEVYIEGASSSDSEGEGFVSRAKPGAGSKTKPGAMSQTQKKTASVTLTIRSASPKSPEVSPHRTTLVQSISPSPQRVQSPLAVGALGAEVTPPVFTKPLQDTQAQEGQVVVLECRVRGAPPLQVHWVRQGQQIQDSPDFRILQKKPRSAAEPEEICTLVIAETFPEDAGQFQCTATNRFGTSSSTAQLTVQPANEESATNGSPAGVDTLEDPQSFPPPPPPPIEISQLELPPKVANADTFHVNELEIWPSTQAPATTEDEPPPYEEAMPNQEATPLMTPSSETSPLSLPFPGKNDLPLPTKPKPKLNPEQLKHLQEQIFLERQGFTADWQPPPQQHAAQPPSPPLPPPPSYQELESSTQAVPPLSTPAGIMQTASTFNYARPKQFIAAQSPGTCQSPSPGSSSSTLSSPLSPPLGRVGPPLFQQPQQSGSDAESPVSPSFPPPPPPFLGPAPVISPGQEFPPPPPPPPPAPSSGPMSPTPSEGSVFSAPQSPAGFLVSVLPSQPQTPPVNALGLPKGNGIAGFPRKMTRTPRIASDSEIQGSKDAVIQDLERKLRFKEERMSNGQQKLTYEEKMARRLLGADNAATVFNVQEPEENVTQEYKVSSFEQRLISEIEFRLERSPVEESDEDIQHDEDAPGQRVAPFFDQKLKHLKVFEGMPVTFTCKVIGDPKPKIYWFKDGKQISKRSEHYRIGREPDGTCTLHTAAALLDDDGNYTIMASNPEGRTSCTGRMMVQAVNQRGRSHRATPGHIRRPRSRSRDSAEENDNIQERHFRPHFLQAPGDLIVQEGKLCRMDCKVSGLPTPDLIWQLNGQTIRPDSAHKMLVRENGVHSLVIEPVTSRDAGIYTCIASNRAGQNSFNLELIVAAKEMHQAPSFVEKLQNTSVAEGHPVRLECRIAGVPFPQIFWKKENESLTHNTERLSMHQDNHGYICMIIQPAYKEDAGWYTVSAKNEAGIVSNTARLDIHTQWQQTQTAKPRKVRPSASRYAALTEKGLDVKAAFFPDSSPVHHPGGLVESDDL
uniref:Palladin n=1 Tax=Paramormyrops kingsleyae TaxID=1676925 RepID=A0A3B3RL04_9TELE|nr:palladin isoform X2 [Paramormyrops kingsleyae]